MWFLLGFVTLAGFVVLSAWQRLQARWRGEQHGRGDRAYEYREWSQKGKVKSFRIAVPARADFDFALKPETRTDRVFKAIGLSREHQVADAAFDRAVYVVSDDTALCARLAAAPELRADLHAIFEHRARDGCYSFKQLRCTGGRVWLEYAAKSGFQPAHADHVASVVVGPLHRVSRDLEQVPAQKEARWRDPFVIRAALILAVSTGLAINGAVQLFRIGWSEVPFTESPGALFPMALAAGLVLTGVLAAATLVLVGRTARAHLVLLEILLVGSFGSIATAYAVVRDINMEWDRADGQVYEVPLLDKRVSRGRRSSSYYLRLQPWPGHRGDGEIRVSRDAYDWFRVSERIHVHVRPGFFGERWIANVSSAERR